MTEHGKHPRFRLLGAVARAEDFEARLTMLSPDDGAVTRQGSGSVIGQVRDPGLGAMIAVNEVPALVYGRRSEARVPF